MTCKALPPLCAFCTLLAFVDALAPMDGAALDRRTIAAAQPVHVDVHGDALPLGAVARLGTTRLRGVHEVQAVAFSPDGKLLASRGRGSTELWDAATGRALHLLDKPQHSGTAMAFTPDSKRLVTGGTYDQTVCVWDTATGRLLDHFPLPQYGYCEHCTAGPGHRLAIATTARAVYAADDLAHKDWQRLGQLDQSISALAISTQGTVLAAADEHGSVAVWDAATHQQMFRTMVKGGAARLVFSPDGKRLAVATRATLAVLDATKGTVILELSPLMDSVITLWFSPDGMRLAAGGSGDGRTLIRFWDTQTGKVLHTTARPDQPRCLAFTPDGTNIASSHFSQRIDIWNVVSGKSLPTTGGHAAPIDQIALLSDGKTVVTTAADRQVRHWDAATGRALGLFHHQDGNSWQAANVFTGDGTKLVTWDQAKGLAIWDSQSGMLKRQPVMAAANAEFLEVARDGKTVVLASPGEVLLWDVAAGRALHKLPTPKRVERALLSPDGRLLAMQHGGCDLWEVATGKMVRHLADFESLLAFSPDGTWLIGRTRNRANPTYNLIVAETELVNFHLTLEEDARNTTGIVFSPSGRLMAVLNRDGRVQLWEVPSRLLLWEFTAHKFQGNPSASVPSQLRGAVFFPDGWRLAIGLADTTVLVWDLAELVPGAMAKAKLLDQGDLEKLWSDLESASGNAVFRAQALLAGAMHKTVGFLKPRLEPTPPLAQEHLAKLLADLDGPFAVRAAAVKELAALGDTVELQLRAHLKKPLPLEVERRIEALLGTLYKSNVCFPNPKLRVLRAISVLERIGTPEARQLLAKLAGGAAGSRQTREAAEASKRLAKLVPAS
jgi:WD40 repeat protein